MVNFMVDLETLSTEPNAIILTIGCVPFGSDGSHIVTEDMYFYNRVELSSYNDIIDKFHMDFNTLLWWLEQDNEPLSEAFKNGPRKPIAQAIADFALWIIQICKYCQDSKITMWSHGKDFDCVILQSAFKVFGIPCPWSYWDTRDTRTIYALTRVDLRNIQMPDGFKAHNAIGDCLKQIEGIRQSFMVINNINDKNSNNQSKSQNNNSNNSSNDSSETVGDKRKRRSARLINKNKRSHINHSQ